MGAAEAGNKGEHWMTGLLNSDSYQTGPTHSLSSVIIIGKTGSWRPGRKLVTWPWPGASGTQWKGIRQLRDHGERPWVASIDQASVRIWLWCKYWQDTTKCHLTEVWGWGVYEAVAPTAVLLLSRALRRKCDNATWYGDLQDSMCEGGILSRTPHDVTTLCALLSLPPQAVWHDYKLSVPTNNI